MDDQEMELVRQRMAFLEQTVERLLEELAALQTRVAMLEARPVAVAREAVEQSVHRVVEMGGLEATRAARGSLKHLLEPPAGAKVWENDQRDRK